MECNEGVGDILNDGVKSLTQNESQRENTRIP